MYGNKPELYLNFDMVVGIKRRVEITFKQHKADC